jgi:hypothetical protein
MRIASLTLIVVLLMAASCQSSTLPSSSLTIRNAATNALISAPTAQGVLSLTVGGGDQIKVMRTWTNQYGNTLTDDVTQFTNFKWESGAGFATFDQLGNISGVAAGIAVLEAKFRADPLDPWDICKLTVEVT